MSAEWTRHVYAKIDHCGVGDPREMFPELGLSPVEGHDFMGVEFVRVHAADPMPEATAHIWILMNEQAQHLAVEIVKRLDADGRRSVIDAASGVHVVSKVPEILVPGGNHYRNGNNG